MHKLIIQNLLHKPLNTVLSILLLCTGTAIIIAITTLQQQAEQKFLADLQDIDMVVGAKGSPLQLVLSAVYQLDAPTGNIPMKEVETLASNLLVEKVTPLAYGDNYKGYRIVGTDSSYTQKYNATLQKGTLFNNHFEAVIGSNVANSTALQIGSTFNSTHGLANRGESHDNHSYTVVGILQPTQTVVDNLVLCSVETIHHMHEHEADTDTATATDTTEAITAALIKFRSPMGLMVLPRTINENSNVQAAVPSIEINRLTNLLGIGFTTIQYVAIAIVIMAAISIFISLFSSLQERKHELALLRSYGYTKIQLLYIVFGESILLCTIGFILGYLLSLAGLHLLNQYSIQEINTSFIFNYWSKQHSYIFVSILIIGVVAAIIPAIKTYYINIAKTLSHA